MTDVAVDRVDRPIVERSALDGPRLDGPAPAVAQPERAVPPRTADVPATGWAKLPPWALILIVVVALLGFTAVIYAGWQFVLSNDEIAEREDWDQIAGLIDRVDNLVLFVLGALFGVAVQARQTAEAKGAADANRIEAEEQYPIAQRNEDAARGNARAALLQADLLRETTGALRETLRVIEHRRVDGSLHVPEGRRQQVSKRISPNGITVYHLDPDGDSHVLDPGDGREVDPELERLERRVARTVQRADEGLLRRS